MVESILSSIIAAIIIIICTILLYKGIAHFQLGRLIIWRLKHNKEYEIKRKTIFIWNKLITNAIKIVNSDRLMVSKTYQKSPPGMPLAICSKEFYKNVIFMTWLSAQPGNKLYNKIINTTEYNSELVEKFKSWSSDLLESYENDFELIKLLDYSDFIWIFEKTINKI